MNAAHTSGPWKAVKRDKAWAIETDYEDMLNDVICEEGMYGTGGIYKEEDAILFAAAPRIFIMLKIARQRFGCGCGPSMCRECNRVDLMVDSAIYEAKGSK